MPNYNSQLSMTTALLSARRGPRKDDPTLREAIDAFIEHCRMEQKETSVRSIISVLRGGRQATKKAAGTPLARTHLGDLKTHRVTVEDLKVWFNQRHEGLGDDARKRGNTHLTQLICYCILRGWMDRGMFLARASVPASEKQRHWLTPETVAALVRAVEECEDERFDAYWRFSLRVDLETGIRPAEKQELAPGSLDVGTGKLHIAHGKGRGAGKARKVTVSGSFIAAWQEHIRTFGLRANHRMFFERALGKTDGVASAWRIENLQKPCSTGAFLTMYAAVTELAQSELDPAVAPMHAITPRVMRRTFACLNCIAHARHERGARDLMQLRDEMGHNSLEVTARYLSDVADYLARGNPRVGVWEMVERLTQPRSDVEAR